MIPFASTLFGDPTLKLIVACLALVGAAIGGASLMADRKNAEIAEIQSHHAQAQAAATQAALERLLAARRRGDLLEARIATSEAALQNQTEEKEDAIRRLTVGRPCLDGAAVRVLNSSPGLKPSAVSEATGQPLSADAAFATDTDVGVWAAGAWRQYDTCRGRLQAVADFFGTDTSAATSGMTPNAATSQEPISE